MPAVQDNQDADAIAFGKFLMKRGVLTSDQVRKAYQLLQGYRQRFPSVNLAQVLDRHGMADKDVLRPLYQEFKGAGGASPPLGGSGWRGEGALGT